MTTTDHARPGVVPGGSRTPRPVRFRDLGPLLVEQDGRPRPVGGARLEAALALLLVHAGRRVGLDALVEAMWGADGVARSASTLDSHVFRLRRALEPHRRPGQASTVLVRDNGGYRLVATADQVDSLRFARLAGEAADLLAAGSPERALRRAEEALALWRGRPYGEAADTAWAEAATARLDELHAQVGETHIEALLATGAVERALVALESALAANPLRERLWAQRMVAFRDGGRRADALRAYARAREVLAGELGIEPGPELRALQAELLAGDAPPPVREMPVTANLPVPRHRLVGRDHDLAALTALLAAHPVVTLAGAAGCGKTRLAVDAASGLPCSVSGIRSIGRIRTVDAIAGPCSAATASTQAAASTSPPGQASAATMRTPASRSATGTAYRTDATRHSVSCRSTIAIPWGPPRSSARPLTRSMPSPSNSGRCGEQRDEVPVPDAEAVEHAGVPADRREQLRGGGVDAVVPQDGPVPTGLQDGDEILDVRVHGPASVALENCRPGGRPVPPSPRHLQSGSNRPGSPRPGWTGDGDRRATVRASGRRPPPADLPEGTVTSLSVWVFDTSEAAEPALRTLGRLEMQGHLAVDDAAVVAWPDGDVRPRAYQAGAAGGAAALSGAFWGLLFGVVFLLPLTDHHLREGDGGFGLDRVGLPDRFLGEVRDRAGPGTSALFLLTPDAAVDRVAAAVGSTGTGGLVARFTGSEERNLRRAFAAAGGG